MENKGIGSPPNRGVGEGMDRTDSSAETSSSPNPAGQNKLLDAGKIEITGAGDVFDISVDGDNISIDKEEAESLRSGVVLPGMSNFITSHNLKIDEIKTAIGSAIKNNAPNTMDFFFDDTNGIRFSTGNTYKITGEMDDKGQVEKFHYKFLFYAPLKFHGVAQNDIGEYLIKYNFQDKDYIDSARDTVSRISVNVKTTRDDNKALSELLQKYIEDEKAASRIEEIHDAVYIDSSGTVRVNYHHNVDNIANLSLLREFYDHTMNQHAYLSGLAYNLIAPLSHKIREFSPAGYIFPTRISSGRTGAAKTTTDSIFILTGWDQTKEEGILTAEQVATHFTFLKNMSNSNLPVLINDVVVDFFEKNTTMLKNASENAVLGDRGNADQSITRSKITRAMNITTNEETPLSDDAAQHRRYIHERYTEDHEKRKDLAAYRKFMAEIQRGFFFGIFEEIYEGKKLSDIIDRITSAKDSSEFVNIILNDINELCRNIGVQEFPKYDTKTLECGDSFTELCEYFLDQWNRLQGGDYSKPYPELSRSEIDVVGDKDKPDIWFTGAAYKIARKRLDLKHKNVKSLFSNYVQNPIVEIHADFVSHRFVTESVKAFALTYKGGDKP